MDDLDDDINEPKAEVKEIKEAELPAVIKKTEVMAVDKMMAIAPKTVDEAWRLSEAFVLAGMVPSSLMVKGDNKATTARVMTVMLKGLEVGFGPATALQTIMVVNNKPCVYGDGVSALLQKSGVVEAMKTTVSGKWSDQDYTCTVSIKRKDQSEPYVRSFGHGDAKKAGLLGKSGPWTLYPERMCYWRALSWAARDAAGDALIGLGIAEEVTDYMQEKKSEKTDTSSLED